MPRKPSRVNPLELRKELLIAESEINRAQLLEEWRTMSEGVHTFTHHVKTVSSLAAAAALVTAAVSAFRRSQAMPANEKASWLSPLLRGAQLATSLWQAFRARQQ
ncbi:MAG: hypothetical protein JWR69_3536 [Pedosphaera sp.]|nr:hypothetical protein [Pedosphaera sp.]